VFPDARLKLERRVSPPFFSDSKILIAFNSNVEKDGDIRAARGPTIWKATNHPHDT
jgi:hypothetical protein